MLGNRSATIDCTGLKHLVSSDVTTFRSSIVAFKGRRWSLPGPCAGISFGSHPPFLSQVRLDVGSKGPSDPTFSSETMLLDVSQVYGAASVEVVEAPMPPAPITSEIASVSILKGQRVKCNTPAHLGPGPSPYKSPNPIKKKKNRTGRRLPMGVFFSDEFRIERES